VFTTADEAASIKFRSPFGHYYNMDDVDNYLEKVIAQLKEYEAKLD
jgi:hypothetical protein